MNQEMTLNRIAALLREETRFLRMTHEEPDADGIGSMLALGKALQKERRIFKRGGKASG